MASFQPLNKINFTRVSIDNDKAQLIKSDVNVLLRFIKGLPKAELHVHIEGTIEPDMMLNLAKRNQLTENEVWKKEFEYYVKSYEYEQAFLLTTYYKIVKE